MNEAERVAFQLECLRAGWAGMRDLIQRQEQRRRIRRKAIRRFWLLWVYPLAAVSAAISAATHAAGMSGAGAWCPQVVMGLFYGWASRQWAHPDSRRCLVPWERIGRRRGW